MRRLYKTSEHDVSAWILHQRTDEPRDDDCVNDMEAILGTKYVQ
jgi:hypothetical protein